MKPLIFSLLSVTFSLFTSKSFAAPKFDMECKQQIMNGLLQRGIEPSSVQLVKRSSSCDGVTCEPDYLVVFVQDKQGLNFLVDAEDDGVSCRVLKIRK